MVFLIMDINLPVLALGMAHHQQGAANNHTAPGIPAGIVVSESSAIYGADINVATKFPAHGNVAGTSGNQSVLPGESAFDPVPDLFGAAFQVGADDVGESLNVVTRPVEFTLQIVRGAHGPKPGSECRCAFIVKGF